MITALLAAEGVAKLGAAVGAGLAAIGAGLGIGKIGGQAMVFTMLSAVFIGLARVEPAHE